MKLKRNIKLVALLLLSLATFFPSFLLAQSHTLSGKITDERNRQPLAFVNVVVNNGTTGGMSDIDGKFEITASEPIRKVKFSCIGYETKEIDIQNDKKKLNITLTPVTIELQEVTVEAGENPAHRIIDSLMAHRKTNNPNSLASYRYKMYDQMVFTIDSSDFGKAMNASMGGADMQMFDSLLKKSDLMVMETASEVLFKAPDRKLQNVLGTKVSGLKNPTFIYLVNSMQSTSFYDESINVAGADYVNPISRGSKRHYFFTLESISPIGQGDSLYVISFHPMRGSTFKGLRGTMTVNSSGWALQSVKAEPNEQEGLFTISIQQLDQKVSGHWFPKQLNTNLVFSSATVNLDGNNFPMVAIGKSYLTDIEINPEISRRQFSDIEINVHPDAGYRDESFWNDHRIDSLTERIRATYILVDSLTGGTDIFDRVMNWTSKLMYEDVLSLGPIDFNLGSIVKLSMSKGFYFGLGASTNDRFSRHIRLNAFGGYWTRMKGFDYGGGIKWLMDRQRQMELSLQYSQRSEALGEFSGMQEGGGLLSANNYKYTFYENVDTRSNRLTATYSTRFARHFKVFLNFSGADKRYLLPPFDTLPTTRYATAEMKLRFAYKEKFLSQPNGIRSLGTVYPIVWLSYTHAFPNLLGSQYEYDRFKLEATQNIYTPYLGVARIVLQAGYASQGTPIMETFSILGSYELIGLYAPGSFSTMREHEFFCDRFVALYLSHNFSGMLWKTNSEWFKPELTLATNLGWGDMHRHPEFNDLDFKTMEKGYFESGFVVNGLLATPFTKIGLGVFYRYGPYALDGVWKNFAFKWCATFSF